MVDDDGDNDDNDDDGDDDNNNNTAMVVLVMGHSNCFIHEKYLMPPQCIYIQTLTEKVLLPLVWFP